MAIVRRKSSAAIKDYHTYREYWWGKIDRLNFDPRGSDYVVDGVRSPMPPNATVLVPKPILFYKDVWHCGSREKAQQVLHDIALFPDLRFVELKGTWVWVDWDHYSKPFELPGQVMDDRSKYRGR